jgi:hypothetical protein
MVLTIVYPRISAGKLKDTKAVEQLLASLSFPARPFKLLEDTKAVEQLLAELSFRVAESHLTSPHRPRPSLPHTQEAREYLAEVFNFIQAGKPVVEHRYLSVVLGKVLSLTEEEFPDEAGANKDHAS